MHSFISRIIQISLNAMNTSRMMGQIIENTLSPGGQKGHYNIYYTLGTFENKSKK